MVTIVWWLICNLLVVSNSHTTFRVVSQPALFSTELRASPPHLFMQLLKAVPDTLYVCAVQRVRGPCPGAEKSAVHSCVSAAAPAAALGSGCKRHSTF